MIRVSGVDPDSQKALATVEVTGVPAKVNGGLYVPIMTTLGESVGSFKAVSVSGASTTTIASPNTNGSLLITDLIVSSNKVNNGTVIVSFSDGTNSVVMAAPNVTDAPTNFSVNFAGRWQGWRDAYIRVVTSQALQEANIAIGYVKLPEGIPYLEWDALR